MIRFPVFVAASFLVFVRLVGVVLRRREGPSRARTHPRGPPARIFAGPPRRPRLVR